MDVLQYMHAFANAALTGGFGLFTLVVTYPEQVFWLSLGSILVWLTRRIKRIRRLQDWYIRYPIQRYFHRLFVPLRKRLAMALMCRVKKSVLADKIDDLFERMVIEGHITRHDKRELCVQIGLAINASDLIPRGKRHKEAVRRTVLENIKRMRESFSTVRPDRVLPGTPEPAEPGITTLKYLRRKAG